MRVSLALPTVEPLAGIGDRKAYDACVVDIVSSSGVLKTLDKALHGADLIISHSADASEHHLIKDRWKLPDSQRDFGLLVVSADLSAFARDFRAELAAEGRARSTKAVESLVASYCVENLVFEINTILLLANILRPGALTTATGFAFANDVYIGATREFNAEDWYRATQAADKYGCPPLQTLSIPSAWSWLAATRCVDNGIARGPIGRALAALSYVAPGSVDSESSLNLAWVLLGLEALYCTSNIGLREQLIAKTELVLGHRNENKKAFGAMYDFRSRFLHGDMDLPLRYSTFNAVPAFERHYSDLGDYEGLALAALIGTLQVMIKNAWYGLQFKYELDGLPLSPAALHLPEDHKGD